MFKITKMLLVAGLLVAVFGMASVSDAKAGGGYGWGGCHNYGYAPSYGFGYGYNCYRPYVPAYNYCAPTYFAPTYCAPTYYPTYSYYKPYFYGGCGW